MSLFQVQQCLFDYLRALENSEPGTSPDIKVDGYDLTEQEARALREGDIGAIYAMGTHPVIVNGYCRAKGYKRADYRPLLEAVSKPERRKARWQTS
jgi:hypothetical protein